MLHKFGVASLFCFVFLVNKLAEGDGFPLFNPGQSIIRVFFFVLSSCSVRPNRAAVVTAWGCTGGLVHLNEVQCETKLNNLVCPPRNKTWSSGLSRCECALRMPYTRNGLNQTTDLRSVSLSVSVWTVRIFTHQCFCVDLQILFPYHIIYAIIIINWIPLFRFRCSPFLLAWSYTAHCFKWEMLIMLKIWDVKVSL